MTKLARIYFFLLAIGFSLSGLLQLFFTELVAEYSLFDSSRGWQQEIGLWNVGVVVLVLRVSFKNETAFARFVIPMLLVLFFLLGSNHLVSLLNQDTPDALNVIHWGALALNVVALILGIVVWLRTQPPDSQSK